MGILNVTPDSFSDGSRRALDSAHAIECGLELRAHGADIVDIGGESTRPGADPVTAAEEMSRVLDVVAGLATAEVVVSIDTMKPEVARAAVDAGAQIINDVSGFRDPTMVEVAASTGSGVVVMHMQGDPQTMQNAPTYDDVVTDVDAYLDTRAAQLEASGVMRSSIVVDPGIGFGKTHEHNLALLGSLRRIVDRGRPVLVGVSRKGFIGSVLARRGVSTTAPERDVASAVIAGLAVRSGAAVIRAHDVRATLEAVAVADAIVRPAGGSQRSGDA